MEKTSSPGASEKEIRKNVLSMIIPVTVEGVLQMISSTVLMAMLTRIDVLAVNAMGIGTRITQLLWSFVRGMGVGITVCIAQDVGAKKTDNVKLKSILGVLSLVAIVAFFSGIIITFAEPIVNMFGGNPETMAQSVKYMQIVALGLPFWSVMLSTAGILQGFGDAKTPMKVTIVYNCLNISLGYLMIFGKFGVPQMGLLGAAYSVVITQITMSIICTIILLKKGIISKMVTELRADIKNTMLQLRELYRIGFPSALENMVWQAGALAMMKPVISYGEYPYAAHQLALQAESISYMPTMGFGIATTSLVGRCFGAGDYATGKKYFKKIFKYMAMVSGTTMIIMVVCRSLLMGMLTDDKSVIALGAIYLVITACTLVPQNLHGVYCGALRGAGHTKPPMYIAIACLWGIRVPLSYIFAYLMPMFGIQTTIVWVWIGMSTDILTRFILSSTYYKRANVFGKAEGETEA